MAAKLRQKFAVEAAAHTRGVLQQYPPSTTYTLVLFVLIPLIVLSALALAPGVDAIAPAITTVFGGRQAARLWHFTFMALLIAYFCAHMIFVFGTGAVNNLRSMVTGWYTAKENHEAGTEADDNRDFRLNGLNTPIDSRRHLS